MPVIPQPNTIAVPISAAVEETARPPFCQSAKRPGRPRAAPLRCPARSTAPGRGEAHGSRPLRWCCPGWGFRACAARGCAVTAPAARRHGRPAPQADQDQDRRREAVSGVWGTAGPRDCSGAPCGTGRARARDPPCGAWARGGCCAGLAGCAGERPWAPTSRVPPWGTGRAFPGHV